MINKNRSRSNSLNSSGETEIIFILNKTPKRRKRDENYEEVAKSPQVHYWLNIINDNKSLTKKNT